MKQNNKKDILRRYGAITVVFVFIGIIIFLKLFQNTVINAHAWNERARKELAKIDTIPPERGNILASNGNILACNLKVYDLKIDLRHDKINKLNPTPWTAIDSLGDTLDKYYPRRRNLAMMPKDSIEKYSWRTKLRREFEKDPDSRPRALRFAKNRTKEDLEQMKKWPFLNRFKGKGFRNPLYAEAHNVRMYPYGSMAHRSIGRVNEDAATGQIHGYSGLEKDLDSMLYGKPGYAKKVALNRGVGSWAVTKAEKGKDLLTTIDIDLQDLLEQELHNICAESHAEWGTAILMEVETGEIKAISNLQKLDDGSYGEARNRAVLGFEPGSVMKPISLMIAFEDGLVKSVNDIVDCSPFQRTSDPHAPGVKTMKQVIEMSSNTGISRVIFRKYAKDPAAFHDRLASIGFFEPMHTGIAGETTPNIRRLVDKTSDGRNITMTARHLDLARQAYGYNTEIPPLYTLSVYNAIANKGRYVRPHLVRAYRYADGHDSILPVSYIRDHICSEETARKVGTCLEQVVWGEHGTARAVRDDRVKIVGKTGTAYPVGAGGYDRSKRRYAFAGYFPYENPKYSCMALILAPSGNSANRTSGQVVKNTAVKMYARGLLEGEGSYEETPDRKNPLIAASTDQEARRIGRALGTNVRKVKTSRIEDEAKGKVPDVRGYSIASAVKALEQRGLNVVLRGAGRVISQSPAAGEPIKKGEKIILNCKI